MFLKSNETLLSLEDVSIELPDSRLIKRFSLQLQRKATLALLGKNGVGKTTLLKVIAGLTTPASGHGTITGKVGMVFQNPDTALFGATVEENLAFPLENCGLSREIMLIKVNETLSKFDLADLRGRDVLSLSGGQRQRVSLACAMISEPDLLLLDEPFSMIDSCEGKKIAIAIADLVREGTSVIQATNKFSEVLGYDRFFLLGKNSMIFCGGFQELLKNPEFFPRADMPVPFELELLC